MHCYGVVMPTVCISPTISYVIVFLWHTVFPRLVAAATINFSFTEVWRLFEGSVYSRAAFILPAGLPPFPPRPQRSCELCPWPLALSPARTMADLELELAQFSFSSTIRGHPVYLAIHLRMRIATVHMNIIIRGYCSRVATIMLSSCSVQRLFEGGVYSGCGVYSRKYGMSFHLCK